MATSSMGMGKESTIKEYISNYNSEEITHSAFFLKQVFTTGTSAKILVNFKNLVMKYMPELNDLKVKITLDNDEYSKYKFNPKLLSHDVYGTTELWFLILEANELHSITQFDLKTIYIFNTSIVDKMTRILNLEKESKDYDEEQISAELIS